MLNINHTTSPCFNDLCCNYKMTSVKWAGWQDNCLNLKLISYDRALSCCLIAEAKTACLWQPVPATATFGILLLSSVWGPFQPPGARVCLHVLSTAYPPVGWTFATTQFDMHHFQLATSNYGVKVNDLGSKPDCDNCPKTYSNQATSVNGC